MLNFSEINNFPTYDGGVFDILKEVAGKYCPEEVKEIRRGVIPDESLNLENLEKRPAHSSEITLNDIKVVSRLCNEIHLCIHPYDFLIL